MIMKNLQLNGYGYLINRLVETYKFESFVKIWFIDQIINGT